jgi:hypothetical protein
MTETIKNPSIYPNACMFAESSSCNLSQDILTIVSSLRTKKKNEIGRQFNVPKGSEDGAKQVQKS